MVLPSMRRLAFVCTPMLLCLFCYYDAFLFLGHFLGAQAWLPQLWQLVEMKMITQCWIIGPPVLQVWIAIELLVFCDPILVQKKYRYVLITIESSMAMHTVARETQIFFLSTSFLDATGPHCNSLPLGICYFSEVFLTFRETAQWSLNIINQN